MNELDLDQMVAEKVFGLQVVGRAHCSYYDGCPDVSPLWTDCPIRPVYVRGNEDYRAEVYLARREEELREMSQHLHSLTPAAIAEQMESERGSIVNGWHAFGLAPVPFYSTLIDDAWLVVDQMTQRGFEFELKRAKPRYHLWEASFSPLHPTMGGPNLGVGKDAQVAARAICLASLEVLATGSEG